jgi:glucose-1-phosphate cytidylyltransferase
MKTIILAGGFGTRLSEYTEKIPKPMVLIGGKPILWHIMSSYAKFDQKDFVVALGYKAEVIKDFFLKYRELNSDFTINLESGETFRHEQDLVDWQVTLVDTGLNSMTGGRIKLLKPFLEDETCMLTYGDGLADINITKLVEFHKDHGKLVTVTAVRPAARFGELELEQDTVTSFREKSQLDAGWINGGFFVFEPEFIDQIDGPMTYLEREPLEWAAKMGQLMAYRHEGFWHCMDVKRDHDLLERLWESDQALWAK